MIRKQRRETFPSAGDRDAISGGEGGENIRRRKWRGGWRCGWIRWARSVCVCDGCVDITGEWVSAEGNG